MISVTVDKVLDEYSLKEGDLADKLGISLHLLSKIKNGTSPISDKTQEKFQKIFPNYRLVGGCIKWKDLYINQLDKIDELEKEIKSLKQENSILKDKLTRISNITEE